MPKTNVCKKVLSVEEFKTEAEKYFSGVNHTIDVYSYGATLHVTIIYYDFKPRRQVRNDIEDIAPNIEVDAITREFSEQAILSSYYELCDSPNPLYIMMPNGNMQPISIDALVCDNLAHRTFKPSGDDQPDAA